MEITLNSIFNVFIFSVIEIPVTGMKKKDIKNN